MKWKEPAIADKATRREWRAEATSIDHHEVLRRRPHTAPASARGLLLLITVVDLAAGQPGLRRHRRDNSGRTD